MPSNKTNEISRNNRLAHNTPIRQFILLSQRSKNIITQNSTDLIAIDREIFGSGFPAFLRMGQRTPQAVRIWIARQNNISPNLFCLFNSQKKRAGIFGICHTAYHRRKIAIRNILRLNNAKMSIAELLKRGHNTRCTNAV